MKTSYIIFIVLFITFMSCTVQTLPDEELTMTKAPNNGKEIRTDGYFTGLGLTQTMYYNYLFFYKNGTYFSFSNSLVDNLSQIRAEIEHFKTIKGSWGLYQVNNNIINIQRWRQSVEYYQFILNNYQYKIINDTTIFYSDKSGDTTRYNFIKYSPKPDSTNVFIK